MEIHSSSLPFPSQGKHLQMPQALPVWKLDWIHQETWHRSLAQLLISSRLSSSRRPPVSLFIKWERIMRALYVCCLLYYKAGVSNQTLAIALGNKAEYGHFWGALIPGVTLAESKSENILLRGEGNKYRYHQVLCNADPLLRQWVSYQIKSGRGGVST